MTNCQLILFAVLATAKLVVETFAGRRIHRGGQERSRAISRFFVVESFLAPVLILSEILILGHTLPLSICLSFALMQAAVLVVRVLSIRELGRFYSVHVRICEDHVLVRKGIYRYLRHPIYAAGIIETFAYPLACGAPVSALLLALSVIPVILRRRRDEERALQEKFPDEYEEYVRQTWF